MSTLPLNYDPDDVGSKTTFSYASYAKLRPNYPVSLFRAILDFHNVHSSAPASKSKTLLYMGCGHGLISRELSPHFTSATAIDPSAGMVEQASRLTTDAKITFKQAGAEDLSFLEDGPVDHAVAGQAAHWFDYERAWPELARVVRRVGGLAFWRYKDNIMVEYPQLFPIDHQFV